MSQGSCSSIHNVSPEDAALEMKVDSGLGTDAWSRLGDEERRLKHLVPAPAVSLMKSPAMQLPKG